MWLILMLKLLTVQDQKYSMKIEPIEDVDSNEQYIKDLEAEVETLKAQVKSLTTTQNKSKSLQQSEPSDINCCEAYKVVLGNFHKLLDEILPF